MDVRPSARRLQSGPTSVYTEFYGTRARKRSLGGRHVVAVAFELVVI